MSRGDVVLSSKIEYVVPALGLVIKVCIQVKFDIQTNSSASLTMSCAIIFGLFTLEQSRFVRRVVLLLFAASFIESSLASVFTLYQSTLQVTNNASNARVEIKTFTGTRRAPNTHAFVWGKLAIPTHLPSEDNDILLDASQVIPLRGNPEDLNHASVVEDFNSPMVIVTGHISSGILQGPDSQGRGYTITVNQFLRDSFRESIFL
jgi:hypothetical protein